MDNQPPQPTLQTSQPQPSGKQPPTGTPTGQPLLPPPQQQLQISSAPNSALPPGQMLQPPPGMSPTGMQQPGQPPQTRGMPPPGVQQQPAPHQIIHHMPPQQGAPGQMLPPQAAGPITGMNTPLSNPTTGQPPMQMPGAHGMPPQVASSPVVMPGQQPPHPGVHPTGQLAPQQVSAMQAGQQMPIQQVSNQQMPPPQAAASRLMGPPPPPGQRPIYTPASPHHQGAAAPSGPYLPPGAMQAGGGPPGVQQQQLTNGPQSSIRPSMSGYAQMGPPHMGGIASSVQQAAVQQAAQQAAAQQAAAQQAAAQQAAAAGRAMPPPQSGARVNPLPSGQAGTSAPGSLKRSAPSLTPNKGSSSSAQLQSSGGSSSGSAAGIHSTTQKPPAKKKKLSDKILPQKVRDLVPESQAYMDLLAFERKLDFTITRKRLDIQESLKRPMKQKRRLRIFISHTFFPGKDAIEHEQHHLGSDHNSVPNWELRVEGRYADEPNTSKPDQGKTKRKFSSFFKSVVIELDKDLYGPDNHLAEWHRTANTNETDGFQVKRPGDKNVKCKILLLLDHQPMMFKLEARLARLMGIHTQTRPAIINALWQYIKTHKLQDAHEREYINCDQYLEQIFQCQRMRFSEIPVRLGQLLIPADPIMINYTINVEDGTELIKRQACYDIEVEVDDQLKSQMQSFVMSTSNQQEILEYDNKIHETVGIINELKANREFLLSFASDPQRFIQKWLISQMRDLKIITDQVGNPEEERKSDFFYQAWTQEAVCRYFYGKVQQRRAELEQALGISRV